MEFRILGPLEVVGDDDRLLALGGAKQRALLAILILNANEVVSSDRLIDDIWGEGPPATALNALQVYVSQLRRILGAGSGRDARELISTQPPGYVLLVDGSVTDVERFGQLTTRARDALVSDDPAEASVLLRAALGLWRGEALADFTYEPFAQTHIEQLDEMRLLAFEDRIEADLDLGRHNAIIPEAEAALASDPHRERLRGHLMLALYRSGRQADALQVYEDGRSLLADQLGIDPSPPLQRLHASILRQDPSLDLVATAAEPAPSAVPVAATGAIPLPSEEAVAPSPPSQVPGEQVLPITVLFADVVGSTSIGERLSPEEVRAVIGECLSRMTKVVEDLGGMIQAYMGDGICAYFGIPDAHEDDVERAALAGLRIRRVVSAFAGELESAWGITGFAVRIGINTGRAVVALVGGATPQELAFGDSMNVAARLQALAEPGTVVVGDDVARRIDQRFTLKPLGEHEVKGRKGRVEAWELLGAVSSRPGPDGTPLVGRERELARCGQAIEELEAGRGQVIVLAGDPGIGKSRMVSELRSMADPRIVWLEGGCRAYGGDLPAWPFVEVLHRWLGVSDDDPPMVVQMRLRSQTDALFGEDGGDVRTALARFLALDRDGPAEPPASDASGNLRAPLVEAMSRLFRRLVEAGPVVVVMEDLHDAGEDSLAILDAVLPIAEEGPLLVIITARPVRSAGWQHAQRVAADYRHRLTEIQLERLDDAEMSFLVDALSPTGSLDPETTADLVARANGNPLYLEELVRLMIDSGGFERVQGWTLTSSSSMVLLPPALESLLVSRIQHLAPVVRSLAQAAAVIGQEVPARLLEDVTGPVDMHVGVGELVRAEVLRERRRYPELEYAFKHPLLREATLSTLTPARVRELSGRVGAALEARDAHPSGETLERIAYHYYRSDERHAALRFLELAGQQAIDAGATGQAEQLLQRAKKVAVELGDHEAEERIGTLEAGVASVG